jgi:hypothetical protein
VRLHVQKERHGCAAAQRLSLQSGQCKQRRPSDQRDNKDALPPQLQRISGEMRAAQKLEQRPA